ncbi:phospholipase D-like domain-containing protein [Pseudomonas syringae]|uniref:phospholipase D-like domain-containing protein n=1 Tax=Pseudomonas syringae TaxID=317 RepID=UPI0006E72B09|nr:phospholipase D-like domain-containing protein [Pseudomonas syringae]KPY55886.1 hypothetical protein ALO46_200039 [Pseudomonas syringae pv. solidagae]
MTLWGYSGNAKESVTAHFESIGGEIKKEIQSAKESIRVCVAWISLRDIQEALVARANEGLNVEVVYNDDIKNKSLSLIGAENIKLYPIKLRYFYGVMHNKFCVIDESVVITGSFNWSKRAGSHFENCIVIKNNFELTKQFLHEFDDIVSYFSEARSKQINTCSHSGCRSESFKIGILGEESGLYDESTVGIWEVCSKKDHLNFVRSFDAVHVGAHLGLGEEYEIDDDYRLDKSAMKYQLSREQDCTLKMQQLFLDINVKVDAIGMVFVTNSDDTAQWSAEPEFGISMLWRNIYYRKAIPVVINDGDNDIDLAPIVNRHYYTN